MVARTARVGAGARAVMTQARPVAGQEQRAQTATQTLIVLPTTTSTASSTPCAPRTPSPAPMVDPWALRAPTAPMYMMPCMSDIGDPYDRHCHPDPATATLGPSHRDPDGHYSCYRCGLTPVGPDARLDSLSLGGPGPGLPGPPGLHADPEDSEVSDSDSDLDSDSDSGI